MQINGKIKNTRALEVFVAVIGRERTSYLSASRSSGWLGWLAAGWLPGWLLRRVKGFYSK